MNYLLHFERPFKHAKHYLGFTTSLSARLDHHFSGRGSRLMAAVAAAGICVAVAHIWPDNDRNDERRLKNQKT